MKHTVTILSLTAALLTPVIVAAGPFDRVDRWRLRERAEIRREQREIARERRLAMQETRREERRALSEMRRERARARDEFRRAFRYPDWSRQSIRDAIRDARRSIRQAVRDARRATRRYWNR